ncbi:hypothetical protein [Kitasatospora purpeofusca]|uniref:hypothetical protein n=1 Tax=Kitasatospora purpeofusca TaxID=67352 RepID=UPI0035DB2F2C
MTDAATPGPESLFQQGCAALTAGDEGAADLFERAVRDAGGDMLWRVADAYARAYSAQAAPWTSRAVTSMSTDAGLMVHPGTLRIITDHGICEQQLWAVEVRSSETDRPAVVTALTAALPRLMRVTDGGQELTVQEMDDALSTGVAFYSPNHAAVDAGGTAPRVWLDCKDAVAPVMARAVLHVVIDELNAAGITRAELFTQL